MNTYNWYSQLIKPTWAPPSWLFGPVWTVLYAIIAVSFGTVFYKAFTNKFLKKANDDYNAINRLCAELKNTFNLDEL